jgi:Tfp pilus assembly protein PilX
MSINITEKNKESGAALIIALMVMVVLLGFAALVLSRTVSETAITVNDTAESRSFNAAEAGLEDTTRDFATTVENKLNPSAADITALETKAVPYFSTNGYTFLKKINSVNKSGKSETVTLTKGQFQGLISLRDEWQIDVTATDNTTGVVTQVRRRFFNDRIPIFQFGAFYQDDLELFNPPQFIFSGRVHTNSNFFVNSGGNDIRFKSKITVAGEIVRDYRKTGVALSGYDLSNEVYAPNATNTDISFPSNRGSVTCSSGTGGILKDLTNPNSNFPYPKCVANTNWDTFSKNFEGNVVKGAKILSLPVYKLKVPLIEMVRRGKNDGDMGNIGGTIKKVKNGDIDNGTLSKERYANKEGIRISLADSRDKLPQCADVPNSKKCGVRLDDDLPSTNSVGYQPLATTICTGVIPCVLYKTTAVNGNRLAVNGREVWIKVESVDFDNNNQKPITKDITEDILSLGVTEPIIDSNVSKLQVFGYTADADSRSIIKLQRFAIKGNEISNTTYLTNQTIDSNSNVSNFYNFVVRKSCVVLSCTDKNIFAKPIENSGGSSVSTDETKHYQIASFDGTMVDLTKPKFNIVPFPIQMFDTREGNRSDGSSLTDDYVYKNGVMSLIDIDIANLRRFERGEFNGKLPTTTEFAVSNGGVGLKNTDIPSNRGWVVYFSDRRGDADFDGRYDMEDVNPSSNALIEEDLDGNGSIDVPTSSQEAPTSDSEVDAAYAAVTDHKFYRRGVRLINAKTLPGEYVPANEADTKGFTFSSENGIYVLGNYNAQSATVANGTASTTSDKYVPYNTSLHIPASIVGDSVTILSNNWNDAKSFAFPIDHSKRPATDTQVRFAMLAGDSLTASNPNPSTAYEGLNGGLHNFKRFLEDWSNDRLNYSGSLVNIFNSFNNDGRFKCCNTVYKPPTRDWAFEDSFTNPNRLPPGTPFVYFITFTGFERVND